MKTLRILILLTTVLVIGLASCSSNDDEKEKKEETLETLILGTWNIPSVKMPMLKEEPVNPSQNYLRFNSDGTAQGVAIDKPINLTYKINGKIVTLTRIVPDLQSKERVQIEKMKVLLIDATMMFVQGLNRNTEEPMSPGEATIYTKQSN